MFENFKDETINEFNNLFDEQLELYDRIKSFIDFYNLIKDKLNFWVSI
jgi:hypothetical protein